MPDSPKTILVTGAAGFIASHLSQALLRRGDRVVGFDNLDPFYDVSSKRRNLEEVRATAPDRFTFVQGDLCDPAALADLFAAHRPAGVFHLAAKAGVRPSLGDPAGYMRANVMGTTILLDAAREAMPLGCSRFVMASSSSVYGNNKVVPFSEEHDVSGPISPYAASKRACELIAHTHAHLTRMPTACLRFFTVFGPRQRPDLAIRLFLRLASRGEAIPMHGSTESSRDYTFVDDIVAGALAAYDRIPALGYRIWNLGGSSPVTLGELVDTIATTTGKKVNVDHRPARPGDVERTYADLSRSAAELGYRPTTHFREGVRRQWEWMKSVGDV